MFTRVSLLLVAMMLVGAVGAQAQQADAAGDKGKPAFTVEISTVGDPNMLAPKSQFSAGQPVFVKLDLTNTTAADLPLIMGDPLKQLRLKLTRDGRKVAFNRDTQARLDPNREKSPVHHGNLALTLKPSATVTAEVINLGDWYDALEPGTYELTVWRVWGKGHKSNIVSFEVVP